MSDVVDVVGWALRGSTAGVGIAGQAAELFERAREGLPAPLSRSQQLLGGIVLDRRPQVDDDGGPRWGGLVETALWDDGAARFIIVDQLGSREIDVREVGGVSVAASLAGPDLIEVSTRFPVIEAAVGPHAALELLVHDAAIALGLVDGFIRRITELRRDRYLQDGGTSNWRADITEFLGRYAGTFQTLDGLITRAGEIIDAGETAGVEASHTAGAIGAVLDEELAPTITSGFTVVGARYATRSTGLDNYWRAFATHRRNWVTAGRTTIEERTSQR